MEKIVNYATENVAGIGNKPVSILAIDRVFTEPCSCHPVGKLKVNDLLDDSSMEIFLYTLTEIWGEFELPGQPMIMSNGYLIAVTDYYDDPPDDEMIKAVFTKEGFSFVTDDPTSQSDVETIDADNIEEFLKEAHKK